MLLKSGKIDGINKYVYSRLRNIVLNANNYNIYLDRYDGNYKIELHGSPEQYPIIIEAQYGCEHEIPKLESEMLHFYDILIDLPIDTIIDQEKANELWNKPY